MSDKLRNILTLLFVVISSVVFAQENDMVSYVLNKNIATNNVSNSYLSSNVVTAIAQDRNGMMWFGTKRGLNSYDSYNFEEYHQEDGIINATITAILPVGNSLFIGTEKGLCIYDIKSKKSTNFFAETDTLVLPDNHIFYINEPVFNRIVICTKGGTSIYDLKKKTFEIPKIPNYSPEYEAHCIQYVEYDNSWWIGTSNGLVRYHEDNLSLRHLYHIEDVEQTLPDNNLRCMHRVDDTMIFIGTSDGLCQLNAVDQTLNRIDLNALTNYRSSKTDVSKIISLDENKIMVSTYTDGLYIYDYKENIATHISKFDKRDAISDNYIFDVFKDVNGSVWIATFTGLNRFENNLAKFITKSIYENGSLLSINYFLEMNDGNVLIGTESGIKVFNTNDESIRDFKTFFKSKENYFESLYIYSFYLDTDSCLWVGTRDSGLYIYDIKSDKVIDVSEELDIKKFNHAVVREMVCDEFGNFWVATNVGLCCINLKDNSYVFYNHDKKDKKSIPHDDIFDLMLSDDLLYVTTGDGLAVYDYKRDDFTTYLLPDTLTKQDVVKNNGLFDIVEGQDGRYYIGSYSNGMLAFSPDTKTFKTSKREDSFGTMVYAIIPDNNGFLWASTSKGIMKCSLATKDITTYDVDDGLQGNEFTPNAFLRSRDGHIFFGGFNGFNYFKPEEIGLETRIPKIVITELQINGGRKIRYLTHGDTIHLQHNENTFEISFATLNLLRKSMVNYSYKMDNYDDEWMFYSSNHRYVDYSKLRPGTYTFKLKASNEVGIWMEMPLELTIIIHPAWYQRIWFKVVIIMLAASAIYIIVNQRQKIKRQKMEQRRKISDLETQMSQLKQKTLQLQMNPHVIFNTLNSIQQYILDHNVEKAVSYLTRFSRLMRRILNNSNERFIPLADELEAVNLYLELESMRLGNRFSYEVIIDPELDVNNIEIAPLIIQPFVENAIIHGLVPKKDNCFLKIDISKMVGEKLLCVIEDNGVGRRYSELQKEKSGGSHKSYGMSITRRRLEMLSKVSNEDFSVEIIDLYDDDNQPEGTRVNIIISYQD